ncbi:GNAT family N-acetyltransferase [Sphingomonas sp. SM33]|uniref:GNAT family N-acetyltransferase n=1 Tax=Sphingomonas telluris TaxID=2907998 RepID=A0ABS9VJF4_9SPHN|nr:GNAT family N-acetyltransferase [Sphingomonas telluris]MCH8615110.1 GNAT family N-acetyltransferase [Sphingomonas telluris]
MADEIRTERLVLRRAGYEDAVAMHRIMSDPVAMRYWSSPPHRTLDETERWVAAMVEADPSVGDDFLVTLDGDVIGKFGAWKLPEFGFLLDPVHWGKGYASEAMVAFIEHCRNRGATELTADVDPRNLSSIRLLKRHGFVETGRGTGTWQVGDELCDSIYFRLEL